MNFSKTQKKNDAEKTYPKKDYSLVPIMVLPSPNRVKQQRNIKETRIYRF